MSPQSFRRFIKPWLARMIALVHSFGVKALHDDDGAMDNQHTLPFGTPVEVRQEVADNIRIFRGGKGYIVAPCHNIQPNTPTANILALYMAVQEFGQVG